MKKNLIKMRVCLGFDCNPRLDIITYEDELSPDGRPYQSTRGMRNEKTITDFGGIWLKFDGAVNTPYWDAYSILDADGATEQAIAEKAMELHVEALNAMQKGMDEAMQRYKNLKAPALTDLEREVHDKMNTDASSKKYGRVVVPVAEFKRLISENVKRLGGEWAQNAKYDKAKWEEFYQKTLTPDILSLLMKGLPVLKIVGDGIEFQMKELYDQALNATSMKVASDVFGRFVEEMGNQNK